ncbi:MAG: IclR family transcriptional regulator [Phycisphaeraceae bacterium]
MNKDNEKSRYHVPNLERALKIMEHMAAEAQPLGISAIADALDFPKNSVFRIVTTLHDYGYLRRDGASKRFTLGPGLLTLGYAAVEEDKLIERASDVMRDIRDFTNETTLIGVLTDTQGIVLDHVLSTYPVKVVVGVGTGFPLHSAAPAKAMLAALERAERDQWLDRVGFERFTANTITSRKALITDLDAARKRGYAIDDGEHNDGIRCIGAAVKNRRGEPVASIWVTGPSFRMKREDFEPLGKIVSKGAARVSARLGYDGV